jgi:hypothetical protein
MPQTYRRVPSSLGETSSSQTAADVTGDEDSVTTATAARQTNRSLGEKFQDKAIALAWVLTAVIIGWWSSTWQVVRHPTQAGANVTLLQIVALLLGINTVFLTYLTIYLPRWKGLTDSSAWDVYCPAVIPTMTAVGVTAFCLAIRATWPVWGFLSPLILSVQCLGVLFALHFVPY